MLEVDVDGLGPDQRAAAKESIERGLGVLNEVDINVQVIVSSDFNSTVEKYRQEHYKKFGKYSRDHGETYANAKTMPILEDAKLKFKIILAADAFPNWLDSNYGYRMTVLLHESEHIFDMISQAKLMGDEVLFKAPSSYLEEFESISNDIVMEYRAEYRAFKYIIDVIKSIDPNSSITSDMFDGFVDGLKELLQSLASFVNSNRIEFKMGKFDYNQMIYNIGAKVRQMLLVASYVYAHSDSLPNYQHHIKTIEALPEFQRFLGTVWLTIIAIYRDREITKREYDQNDIKKVTEAVDKIVKQCGLTLKDLGDGKFLYDVSQL